MAANRDAASGRLLLDVQHSSRELIRQVSYGLTDLVQNQVLHRERVCVFV